VKYNACWGPAFSAIVATVACSGLNGANEIKSPKYASANGQTIAFQQSGTRLLIWFDSSDLTEEGSACDDAGFHCAQFQFGTLIVPRSVPDSTTNWSLGDVKCRRDDIRQQAPDKLTVTCATQNVGQVTFLWTVKRGLLEIDSIAGNPSATGWETMVPLVLQSEIGLLN
jgi:hypothetical protein